MVLEVPLLSHFKKQTKSLFHLLQDNNNNTTNNTKRDSEMYTQLPVLPHRAQNFPNSSYMFKRLQSLHHFTIGMLHPQSGLKQSPQNQHPPPSSGSRCTLYLFVAIAPCTILHGPPVAFQGNVCAKNSVQLDSSIPARDGTFRVLTLV